MLRKPILKRKSFLKIKNEMTGEIFYTEYGWLYILDSGKILCKKFDLGEYIIYDIKGNKLNTIISKVDIWKYKNNLFNWLKIIEPVIGMELTCENCTKVLWDYVIDSVGDKYSNYNIVAIKKGKYVILNRFGEEISEETDNKIETFVKGMALTKDKITNLIGYYDKSGKVRIPYMYDWGQTFQKGGKAKVRGHGESWIKFIDKDNNVIGKA